MTSHCFPYLNAFSEIEFGRNFNHSIDHLPASITRLKLSNRLLSLSFSIWFKRGVDLISLFLVCLLPLLNSILATFSHKNYQHFQRGIIFGVTSWFHLLAYTFRLKTIEIASKIPFLSPTLIQAFHAYITSIFPGYLFLPQYKFIHNFITGI